MIGLLLQSAAALAYGTAYVIHSVRQKRIPGAVVTGIAAIGLIALCAALVWVSA